MGNRKRRPARVTVAGVGRVEREPDVAHATLTVEATRETAAEARAVAARTADDVVAAVRATGVGRDDLHTASIDVSPAWDHLDGQPVRTGFTVSSRLGVAIRDLDAVGAVIDAALGAGATGLAGVSFGLADAHAASAEARALAVEDARARAATIASAAGAKLGALVEVAEDQAGIPTPMRTARLMAMGGDEFAVRTPVMPGRVEVTVTVAATWELG